MPKPRIARETPRYDLEARVDYPGSTRLPAHRVTNVSLGGICLQTDQVVDTGTQVDLAIEFPDLGERFEIAGEVVWANRDPPTDIGVRFIGLQPAQREVLRRFLEAHPFHRRHSR